MQISSGIATKNTCGNSGLDTDIEDAAPEISFYNDWLH